jgi:hypothetical protein
VLHLCVVFQPSALLTLQARSRHNYLATVCLKIKAFRINELVLEAFRIILIEGNQELLLAPTTKAMCHKRSTPHRRLPPMQTSIEDSDCPKD